jgi:hypothetical protein
MAGTQLEVNEWLEVIGLGEYKKIFEDEGYDDIGVVAELTEEDLNVLRITRPGTRKKLLLKAKALKATLAKGKPPSPSSSLHPLLFLPSSPVSCGTQRVHVRFHRV